MLVSQLGMALAVHMSGAMRPVTVKSSVYLLAVALVALAVVAVAYALFARKGAGLFVLAGICLLAVVRSFLSPIHSSEGELYIRYPSLAAILVVELPAVRLLQGKGQRDRFRLSSPRSVESIFALLALLGGLLVSLMVPVGSYYSWDDETHYQDTIYLSENIYAAFSEADIRTIYDPPIEPYDFQLHTENFSQLNSQDDGDKVIIIENIKAFFPTKIAYFPGALAHWIGRILNLDFPVRYYMGRMANVLLYVLVMYFAIRRLDRGKLLLAILGLSPTMLFLSGNYSYDPWVFAFSALSFAYFFHALETPEEKLTDRELVIMVLAMFVAFLPKQPCEFLLLFLLLMPREKFRDARQHRLFVLSVLALGLLALAFTYATSFAIEDPADDRTGAGNISAISQIAFIMSDPAGFADLLCSFLKSYLSPASASDYFTRFGQMGTIPGIGHLLIAAVCACAAFFGSAGRKETLLARHFTIRIFGLLLFLMMAAALAVLFYLVFTPVGAGEILGCQPRYLYPMLFPFYYLVFGGWLEASHHRSRV